MNRRSSTLQMLGFTIVLLLCCGIAVDGSRVCLVFLTRKRLSELG